MALVLETTGIVLAGGHSRRLGRDKALEVIGGVTLLQRAVEAVAAVCSELLLVTSPPLGERLLLTQPGLRWAADLYPGKGSLGGIYTGLYYSSSFYSLVVACDMPFLNRALLRYLIEQAPGYDLVIPSWNNLYEPLHAVYSRDCLEPIRTLMDADNVRIVDLIPRVRVRLVTEEEIAPFDSQHLSFFNINTKKDLDWARAHTRSLSLPAKERP